MIDALNTLAQGLLIGALYALCATGMSVALGVMRLVNLAHGDIIVLAAFGAWLWVTPTGWSPWLALILIPMLSAVLGYGLQRLVLNRTMHSPVVRPMLVTFGLSILLQNGLLEIFSADSRKISFGEFETGSVTLAPGLTVGGLALLVLAAALVVTAGLHLLIKRTTMGRQFRAVADDADTSALMGINTGHVYGLAMSVAFFICGVAGVLMAAWTSFTPMTGPSRLITSFEAVVIGGLGSIWGTLAGGLLLGLAQAIGGSFNPEWQVLAGHVLFLGIVLWRPSGLFTGSRR